MLLRPGGIALARPRSACSAHALAGASAAAPRASGTLAAHYAPRTPASLVARDVLHAELAAALRPRRALAVMARTHGARHAVRRRCGSQAADDATRYAHDLYDNLRRLDAADADVILIEAVPDDDDWQAIRDRLTRATHGLDDDRD